MTRPLKGILHDKARNAIDLIKIGRKGLTMNDVEDICDYTKIPLETLLGLISVSPNDLNEGGRLPKLPSSNLLLISNLYAKGYRVFKDRNAFYEWMNKRNGRLSAEVPFDLLDTAIGVKMIEKALEKALEPTTGISALRGKVTPMTEEEIDNQLQKLKAEWERDVNSIKNINEISKYTQLSIKDLSNILSISEKQLEEGTLLESKEHLTKLLEIYARGYDMFGRNDFKNWLKHPNQTLDGKTPFELLHTASGIQEVSNTIGRIEHGIPA